MTTLEYRTPLAEARASEDEARLQKLDTRIARHINAVRATSGRGYEAVTASEVFFYRYSLDDSQKGGGRSRYEAWLADYMASSYWDDRAAELATPDEVGGCFQKYLPLVTWIAVLGLLIILDGGIVRIVLHEMAKGGK